MTAQSDMRDLPLVSRSLFSMSFVLEHFFPGNARIKAEKDRTRRHVANIVQRGGPGRVVPVERVKSIEPDVFRSQYLAKGIPLIIENGIAGWPLAKNWSFERFTERFGASTIKLCQRKGLTDDDWVDEKEFTEEIQFAAFLRQVLDGGRKYMRFAPLLEQFPELLDDFDQSFFRRMTGHQWGLTYQLFIGGRGTYTPLHNALTSFFFANVQGVKRWALIPCHYLPILNPSAEGLGYNHSEADIMQPDDPRFPGLNAIDRWEAVLQPGDVLYNPSWMWHSVENEAPTIGVRCGFIYPRGMLNQSMTLSFLRVFAQQDQSLLDSLRHAATKSDLKMNDFLTLSPKLLETLNTHLFRKHETRA